MILLSFRLFGDCEHNILIAEIIQQRDLERDADLGNVRVEAEVRQQADPITSLTPRDTTFHTTKRRHCRQRAMCPSRKVMRPLRK